MPAGPKPLAAHDTQLALLSEVARIATADLELRPMLQRVTDLLHERIGWEFVSLATLDFERGEISCEALSTTMQTPLEVGQRWPLGTGVVGAVATSGNTRSYADVRQSDTYVGVNPGTMSELCVPVRHRGRVVAVLNLESRRIGAFDGQQGFVETVAEQVAGPIAGAHLYEEMRQRAAFTEVMAEVSRIALDPAPLDELLHRIVEYIADSFAMPVAAIYLLDEDGARFVREVHHGAAAKPLPEEKWSVAHGVAGRCAAAWAVPQRIVAAWANNDADAFAKVFAEDGTMILPGLYRSGREAIRAYMANAFAGPYKGTKVTGQPNHIKFLGPDAMLLITAGGVLGPTETQVSDVRAIRGTWLVVKQGGQWLLAAYQNCPAVPAEVQPAISRK